MDTITMDTTTMDTNVQSNFVITKTQRQAIYSIVSCPDPTPHAKEKGSGYNTTSRSTLEGRNQMTYHKF